MGAVICLANAKIELQVAWAFAYLLIGSLYWIFAAIPDRSFWDTSCYSVSPEYFSDSRLNEKGFPSRGETYTDALWKAIAMTQNTG